MWATDKGHLEMVRLLLKKGANPNIAAKVTVGKSETLYIMLLSMFF